MLGATISYDYKSILILQNFEGCCNVLVFDRCLVGFFEWDSMHSFPIQFYIKLNFVFNFGKKLGLEKSMKILSSPLLVMCDHLHSFENKVR